MKEKSGILSNKQILIRNTFWLGALEFCSKILMFFVVVGLVRFWGASEFGSYNLAFAYLSIFMILADFGLSTIATRDIAKHRDLSEKYLSNLIGIKIFLSIGVVLLLSISFLVINRPVPVDLLIVTLFFSLGQSFLNLFIALFRAWEKMEAVFINQMIFYLGSLVSALLVIKFGGRATHLALGYSAATLLSIILGLWQINLLKVKVRVSFDFIFWKKLIKEALPLLGMTAAMVIYANNDTLLIGRYFGNDQVGWYQTAYKILFAFQSINVINNAIFPRLTILFHEKKKETANKLIKNILLLSFVGLIPLALFITWQRDLIIGLIYGKSFLVAAGVMSLLIWSGVINYFRVFVGNLLLIQRKQKIIFWTIGIGTVLNLLTNYFLIPKVGFTQGGISLILSEVLILVLMLFGLREKQKEI